MSEKIPDQKKETIEKSLPDKQEEGIKESLGENDNENLVNSFEFNPNPVLDSKHFEVGKTVFKVDTYTGEITPHEIKKINKRDSTFFDGKNWIGIGLYNIFDNKEKAESFSETIKQRVAEESQKKAEETKKDETIIGELREKESVNPIENSESEKPGISGERITKPSDSELRKQISGTLRFKDLGEKASPKGTSAEDMASLSENFPPAEPAKIEELETLTEEEPAEQEKFPGPINEANVEISEEKEKPTLKEVEIKLKADSAEEIGLEDLFTEEELKETVKTLDEIEQDLENLDGIDFEKGSEEIETEIREVIDKISEKKKIGILQGLADIGFKAEQKKNAFFKRVFSKLTESISLDSKKEYTDLEKKSLQSLDFIRRRAESLKEIYSSREEESKKKAEKEEKSKLEKASGIGKIPSFLIKIGRTLYDYNYANPLRGALAGSVFFGFISEIEKEARLKRTDIIEKTRVQNEKEAEEEARALYEKAALIAENKNSGEEVTFDNLEEAYKENLNSDILNRINKSENANLNLISGFASNFIKKSLEKENKKRLEIENNNKLSSEEKENLLKNLNNKNEKLFRDLDRIVGDMGTVDTVSYALRLLEKYSKVATTGLVFESGFEAGLKGIKEIWNLFSDHDKSLLLDNASFSKEKTGFWGRFKNFFMKETPAPPSSDIQAAEPLISETKRDDSLIKKTVEKNKEIGQSLEKFRSSEASLSENKEHNAGVIEEFKIAETTPPNNQIVSDVFKPAEYFEYQGGKSIWKEAELQLQKRFKENFSSLGSDEKSREALKTYNIDRVKDLIVSHPEDYGLKKEVKFNRMTKEMIASINWDKAFQNAFPENKIAENLSSGAVENIVKNNEFNRASLKELIRSAQESAEKQKISDKAFLEKISELPVESETTEDIRPEESLENYSENEEVQQEKIEGGYVKESLPPENLPLAEDYQNEEGASPLLNEEKTEQAILKLKNDFLIEDNNKLIENLGLKNLEKENPEKVNEILISLSKLNLDSAAEAKRVFEVSDLSGLSFETIAKHGFALNDNFSPEQSSALVELLENGKDKDGLKFFENNFKNSKPTLAEKFIDRRRGESLRIFFTGKNKRFDFELVINRSNFFIENVNKDYSLKDFNIFLKHPEKFITSLKR